MTSHQPAMAASVRTMSASLCSGRAAAVEWEVEGKCRGRLLKP